jgi:hypothetical protein
LPFAFDIVADELVRFLPFLAEAAGDELAGIGPSGTVVEDASREEICQRLRDELVKLLDDVGVARSRVIIARAARAFAAEEGEQ